MRITYYSVFYGIVEGMDSTLALLTVVYRNYDILTDFFATLETQTDKQFHVFLADLTDTQKQTIPQRSNCTILHGENKGYAHGVNFGLHIASQQGYQSFCVINSDVFFDSQFVHATRASLRENPHSLIGGKIFYAPGYEYHTNRYTDTDKGKVLWYAGGTADWDHATTHHRGVDEVDAGQYNKKEKTTFITGCLMAFDHSVYEDVGYWDERYFLYYEDADYCERAKRQGLDLWYDPSIMLWHKNAQSTEGSGSSIHTTYQRKNRLRFALAYAPWKTKLHVVKNYLF